jgi:hypothetical protein
LFNKNGVKVYLRTIEGFLLPTKEMIMAMLSRSVFLLCLMLALCFTTYPQASSEESSRTQRIQDLLELTGAGDLGVQVMNQMIEHMQSAMPHVPAEWWNRFMSNVDPTDLNEVVIPIYEKHFTDQEIDAMLQFYQTELGRSIISKLPTVMQESMVAGQLWGQQLATRIIQELLEDGYEQTY